MKENQDSEMFVAWHTGMMEVAFSEGGKSGRWAAF